MSVHVLEAVGLHLACTVSRSLPQHAWLPSGHQGKGFGGEGEEVTVCLAARRRPDDKTLHLNVLDCKDFSSTVMKCRHFFDDYTACHGDTLDAQGRGEQGEGSRSLRSHPHCKGWPPARQLLGCQNSLWQPAKGP